MPETKYYLTKEGLNRIKKEYERLVDFKKAKTGGDVPAIWHSEDINPEYLSFQEDMTLLEMRLVEYENILKNTELIRAPKGEERQCARLGATITVRVDNGQIDEFELVGTLEANPSLGKISNESPVGRAFLGRKVGEEVVVSSPTKTIYRIEKIRYASA